MISSRPRVVVPIDEARARRVLSEFFSASTFDDLAKEAMPSWRGLMGGPIWTEYAGCILTDPTGGGKRTFETFLHGETKPRFPRLSEAKEYVERHLGPCSWRQVKLERQVVEHYYFGETDMFTDPQVAYVATPL